jgi:hypothetical protein
MTQARQLEESARRNLRPAMETHDDARALLEELRGVNREISGESFASTSFDVCNSVMFLVL